MQQLDTHFSNNITYCSINENLYPFLQAGPSFDLPDREKMRRYGWSSGNIGANGHCVLLETEQTQRGSTTSYLRPAQEDLSTDSCGENIRYQAVEGLVQNSRHQMGPKAHLLRSVRLFSRNICYDQIVAHSKVQCGIYVALRNMQINAGETIENGDSILV